MQSHGDVDHSNLLTAMQELADVGGWEYDIECDQLTWTSGTYKIYDLEPSEYTPTVKTSINFYHPDDLPRIQEVVNRALESGEPYQVEMRLITAKGRTIWVESTGRTLWSGGKVCKIFGAIRNITRQKEIIDEIILSHNEIEKSQKSLEGMLRISEFRIETVQNFLDYALSEAVLLTQSVFGYIYFYSEKNQEFTLNSWSKDVMRECSVQEPATKYSLEKTGFWGEVVRQRKPIILNHFMEDHTHKKGYPEGHVALTSFLSVPIFSKDEIVAVVGVANKQTPYSEIDIQQLMILMGFVWEKTEQFNRQSENSELQNLIKDNSRLIEVGLLTSGLIHEVANPLMIISCNVEKLKGLLRDADSGPSKTLGTIQNSVLRIEKLVKGFRSYSQLSSACEEKIQVKGAILEIIDFFKPLICKYGVTIETSFEDASLVCKGDQHKFQQVVLNLLINARDALENSDKPLIKLECFHLDGQLVIKILDNGHGFDQAVKERIFEPFFTTKERSKGSGLGLWICESIVQSFQGTIQAASTVGKGAEFTLTFPAL